MNECVLTGGIPVLDTAAKINGHLIVFYSYDDTIKIYVVNSERRKFVENVGQLIVRDEQIAI